ncbi:hypothetical protein [Lapidilactobacillus wuchangensis]|uniref:hypothetical protein n=1 Tax=Lapidilactobacillus wuchangensis TaxID=2486001 RepID=UPI000F7A4E17|nr:hypothetical protein [Lapidilactobacillus wuchangensis]
MRRKLVLLWLPLIHALILCSYTIFFVRSHAHIVSSGADLSLADNLKFDPTRIGEYQLRGDPLHLKDPLLIALMMIGVLYLLLIMIAVFRAKIIDLALPVALLCLLIPLLPPYTDNIIMKLMVANLFYSLSLLLSALWLSASVKFTNINWPKWLLASKKH